MRRYKIYILYRADVVIYVGVTTNLKQRLRAHGSKKFDRYMVIDSSKTKAYKEEARLIRLHHPEFNSINANPGRKRLDRSEKKIGVTLYIKESIVEKHGGRSGIVIKLMPAVDRL